MNPRSCFFKNSISGFLCIILVAAVSHNSFSQIAVVDNLVTAYHQESNSAYMVQWTIGEIFTGTFASGDIVVSSGINDNAIVYIVMDTEAGNDVANHYRAFPNPMETRVTVRSESMLMSGSVFRFADASGKDVDVPLIDLADYEATFNTEGLPAGFYLLSIQNIMTRQFAHIKLIRK